MKYLRWSVIGKIAKGVDKEIGWVTRKSSVERANASEEVTSRIGRRVRIGDV